MKKISVIIFLFSALVANGQKNTFTKTVIKTDSIKALTGGDLFIGGNVEFENPASINTDTANYADTAGAAVNIIGIQDTVLTNVLGVDNATIDTARSPDGHFDLFDNILYPPHGWAHFADSSVTISVTQNVYTVISNAYDSLFALSHLRKITYSGDTIVLADTAHFLFNFTVTLSGTANDVFAIRVMLDGTQIAKMENSSSSGTERHPISLIAGINADEGSKLWVEITNTTSGDDPVIYSGNWYILYIHAFN
jgi:hypothetical protein